MIFSTINGDSNVNFYNELAAQGITADKIPVVAVSVGEDELRGLDPSKVKGHLAAWNYFQSIDTPEQGVRQEVQGEVRQGPRHRRPHRGGLLRRLLLEAGRREGREHRRGQGARGHRARHGDGIEFDAPEGKVKLDPKTQHTYKYFRMGKIRDDKQFDIIYTTDLIAPDPYPQIAFPGWSVDWTKGGLIKGSAVKIG